MEASNLDFFNFRELLSQEHLLVEKSAREFIEREAMPVVREAYRHGEFPLSLGRQLGDLGFLGAQLSGYGLPGLDSVAYGLIMRELERCDSGLRSFASVQGALVMYPIWAFGSEEQKKLWLPKLASCEVIGCFGLTESEGGSDPSAMRTRAEEVNGEWVLNGSKMWITNGNVADIAIVWAQTEAGVRGFIVPMETSGVSVRKMEGKLSLRASVTSELYFDGVRLPSTALLPNSSGLKSALACLSQARYGIVWGVLGAAEACFAEALSYVKERILFNTKLAAKQLVQRKLALMSSEIVKGQLLALRLAQLKDSGKIHFSQISMAKQGNCGMALDVARTCRNILGANGIIDEYVSMRHMCNLETVVTYEGTDDIHLLIVGSQLTGIQAF